MNGQSNEQLVEATKDLIGIADIYKKWITLISSDWFSVLFTYLDFKEIAKLDIAFCNHSGRHQWLNLLKTYEPSFTIYNNRFANNIADWLVLKRSNPVELLFLHDKSFQVNLDHVSDDCIFKLTSNSSNLKRFEIISRDKVVFYQNFYKVNEMLLTSIGTFCKKIKTLKICQAQIPADSLEILALGCHQLQSITLDNLNVTGVEKLIKTNGNLVSLNVKLYPYHISGIVSYMCHTLEVLGQNCPLLQKCELENFKNVDTEANDIQIEMFTKGCTNLKVLTLLPTSLSLDSQHKLLHCLGSHNPALEILSLGYSGEFYHDDPRTRDIYDLTINSTVELTKEQCQSLQCLSDGCPLLNSILLKNLKLSTPDIVYFINHSIHLEEVIVLGCKLCDDGLVITKEEDKLKYLKTLNLKCNPSIDDESIVNLVKGCHNLEYIIIGGCPKLTDTSLFSIAASCPSLKFIELNFDKLTLPNMTELGLNQLLKMCPNLNYDQIITQLGQRRLLFASNSWV